MTPTIAPIKPNTGVSKFKNVPSVVKTATMSSTFFTVSVCSVMSTFPSPKAFVNPRIWILGGFFARQFLLHPFHTGAEGVAAFAALWLRSFQARLPGVRLVVGSPTFGVQAAFLGFPFLASPCW